MLLDAETPRSNSVSDLWRGYAARRAAMAELDPEGPTDDDPHGGGAHERTLLRRLLDRDERAFRELVEAHRDRVFNITYRMLGDRAEAEDVAQEVFISVFKTIETFREESRFSTWLYRVTVNHCKNPIKYLARRHDRDRDELDETSHETNGAAGVPRHVHPDP